VRSSDFPALLTAFPSKNLRTVALLLSKEFLPLDKRKRQGYSSGTVAALTAFPKPI